MKAPFTVDELGAGTHATADAPGGTASISVATKPVRRMAAVGSEPEQGGRNGNVRGNGEASFELLAEALEYIPADKYDGWFKVTAALRLWGKEAGQEDTAFYMANEWAATCKQKYDRDAQEKLWNSLDREPDGDVVSVGTIFHLAKEHGWKPQQRMASLPPAADDGQDEPEPPIVSAKDLLEDDDITEPPQLVQGLLHRGSRLVLGGHSKAYKSLMMIDLGLSIATGKPFMGFPCKRGRVLIVNLELPDWSMKKRIAAVAKAKAITDVGGLDVMNMRGWPGIRALGAVSKKLCEAAEAGIGYDAILLDPVYRLLGGGDESNPRRRGDGALRSGRAHKEHGRERYLRGALLQRQSGGKGSH